MNRYAISSVITVIALYLLFAGLAAISAVLEWVTWEEVTDWLIKGAFVASIFLVLNIVIALLTQLIPHSDAKETKK